jgi:hypothetical protein
LRLLRGCPKSFGFPHWNRNFSALVSLLNIAGRSESDILLPLRRRILDMKQFLAACVAIAVLWAIDVEFNDGRYTAVVKRAFNSMVAR